MFDLEEGVRPYKTIVFDKVWWACGYCNELIREIDNPVFAEVRFNPDVCPNCKVKINKTVPES